jgi:putative membrane protein
MTLPIARVTTTIAASRRPLMINAAKQLVLSWVANAVVLAVVTAVLSGVEADSAGDLIRAALLFGVLNTILKPVLRLLTLPFAFITLGLVWFGVAMLMLWLTSVVIDGFDIDGLEFCLRFCARAVARTPPRLGGVPERWLTRE